MMILQDPMTDAVKVPGSHFCNPEWKPVNIKNNSLSKYLTVTVEENSNNSKTTKVFERLAPQEQRELGCEGCGWTTTGQLCVGYKILAAVYV